MKRYIKSADEKERISAEDRLADMLAALKDNFNFAIDGIEKISADGSTSLAIEHATTLSEMIEGAIGEIAEDIANA